MKVSVATVISADGKLTRHGDEDVSQWASKEDSQHFETLRNNSDAIIMGSHVYELMKDSFEHSDKRLRIVLTSRPEAYKGQEIPNTLEFHTKTPPEVINYLKEKGRETVLVAGGGHMIADYLKAKLVATLYLTIEPKLFGTGDPLIADELDIQLELTKFKQLNSTGTVLFTYKVL